MPALMATAEYVTKVHAVCARTGNLANHSFRTSKIILYSYREKESYEPLSRVNSKKNLILEIKRKLNLNQLHIFLSNLEYNYALRSLLILTQSDSCFKSKRLW